MPDARHTNNLRSTEDSLRNTSIPAPHGEGTSGYLFSEPTLDQAAGIRSLVQSCPPLDVNSTYAYLLLCHHFSRSCVVASRRGLLVGFVSAYVPPSQPETLFVWQVAVQAAHRGRGIGTSMLLALLDRPWMQHVRRIETTISPSNVASRAMFRGLAGVLRASCFEEPLFLAEHFGDEAHEAEFLLSIGPFVRAPDVRSAGKTQPRRRMHDIADF